MELEANAIKPPLLERVDRPGVQGDDLHQCALVGLSTMVYLSPFTFTTPMKRRSDRLSVTLEN